jgi:exonuclease III
MSSPKRYPRESISPSKGLKANKRNKDNEKNDNSSNIEMSDFDDPTKTSPFKIPSDVSEVESLEDRHYFPLNKPKLRRLKALRLGTFNMRGKSITSTRRSKWPDLHSELFSNNIHIQAVQETHLKDEEVDALNLNFPGLFIHNNPLTNTAGGVAIIIRRDTLDPAKVTFLDLIPGRASVAKFKWGDHDLSAVAIYAPNNPAEKIVFAQTLNETITRANLSNPILLGDWNFVEDALDRLPVNRDDANVINEFQFFFNTSHLVDGWREHNPDSLHYTFLRSDGRARARIDRVYVKRDFLPYCTQWDFGGPTHLSDHCLASVSILEKTMVKQGPGVWRLNSQFLSEQDFRRKIDKLINRAEQEAKRSPDDIEKLWVSFKEDVKTVSGKYGKKRAALFKAKEESLRKKLKNAEIRLRSDPLDEDLIAEAEKTNQSYKEYSKEKSIRNRFAKQARFMRLTQQGTKYFFKLKKPSHAEKTILALSDERGNLKTTTPQLLKVAKNFYQNLYSKGEPDHEAMEEMLGEIPEHQKMTEEEATMLGNKFKVKEIAKQIKKSDSNSSPGSDGLPYEFYKSFPNIFRLLQRLYNRWLDTGVENPVLLEGVLTILYKKGDKLSLNNYRPIQMTNCDYKCYTGIISKRLGKVVNHMLGPEQAGFVPKRHIEDQIKLAELVIDYSDKRQQAGWFLSHDQYKAYDRVDHEWIFKVLEAFKFPANIIASLRGIYGKGASRIMINGFLSDLIMILRGSRQGDPLSCFIFDFAIEPLACKFRNSRLIKGIEIPELGRCIKISLFADDLNNYLCATDKRADVDYILNRFCAASTASFNSSKEQCLPLGSAEQRAYAIENSETLGMANTVADGTPMRVMGGWLGNNLPGQMVHWSKLGDKIDELIKLWSPAKLRLKGRIRITRALLLSRIWYPVMVGHIPEQIIKRIEKSIWTYIWEGRSKGRVARLEVSNPLEKGGLKACNIRAVIAATHIKWIVRWTTLPLEERPIWTFFADWFFYKDAFTKARHEMFKKCKTRLVEPLLQWKYVRPRLTNSNMPPSLRALTKTIRSLKIRVLLDKDWTPSEYTKRSMPLWYNPLIEKAQVWHKKPYICVGRLHKKTRIGDIWDDNEPDGVSKVARRGVCQQEAGCNKALRDMHAAIPENWRPEILQPGTQVHPNKNTFKTIKDCENGVLKGETRTYLAMGDTFLVNQSFSVYTSLVHDHMWMKERKRIHLDEMPFFRLVTETATAMGKKNTKAIWERIYKSGALEERVRDFIWLLAHERLAIGNFFIGWKEEAKNCARCGNIEFETPQHLLLDCPHPGIKTLWKTVSETWEKSSGETHETWSITDIIGAPAKIFRRTNQDTNKRYRLKGREALWQIYVTEAAYVIWLLRNKQIYEEKEIEEKEYVELWKLAIKNRAQRDHQAVLQKLQTHFKGKELYNTWCRKSYPATYDGKLFKFIAW